MCIYIYIIYIYVAKYARGMKIHLQTSPDPAFSKKNMVDVREIQHMSSVFFKPVLVDD